MNYQQPSTASFTYFDTGGNGPVVVLLYGVLMNDSVWTQVVDALRGRYRCIVPELPFGPHARPMPDGANLTLESITRMTAEFLVELQLQNVTLVCNEWGGVQLVIGPGASNRVLVSCEAFDNYLPGLPRRLLCLTASVPGGLFLAARMLRPRGIRNLPLAFGNLSKKGVPDELFMSWIDPLRYDRKVGRDLGKYLRNVPPRQRLLAWAEQQRSFRGPVLIVRAREDKLMPPAHAERLAHHFENARLVWVDDSRTLIPIDQPEVLTHHLRSFLTSSSPWQNQLLSQAARAKETVI